MSCQQCLIIYFVLYSNMLLYNKYCEESKNTEQDAEAEIQTEKDYAARKV